MPQFRKKPVVIETVIWDGRVDTLHTLQDMGMETIIYGVGAAGVSGLTIRTLEGQHLASIGGYIIRGVKGEFYPCKPDIFEQTYEKVEEGASPPWPVWE